jgi:SpoVK/Ycf46/Vps4 family AAA+-type ATPase
MNDLDSALLSRFDQIIKFPYPNAEERAAIFSNYAKQLSDAECNFLGSKTENLTGRNIKDICELAERRWVRRLIVQKGEIAAPPFDYYRQSVQLWKNSISLLSFSSIFLLMRDSLILPISSFFAVILIFPASSRMQVP